MEPKNIRNMSAKTVINAVCQWSTPKIVPGTMSTKAAHQNKMPVTQALGKWLGILASKRLSIFRA
jgi:hypothetical protein